MTTPAFASPSSGLRRSRRRMRISLTPLIDVVFILLVFFMLASSFRDERAVAVDAAASGSGGTAVEGALLVELRLDGLRLGGRPVTAAELGAGLRQHAVRDPAQRVLLKPAPGVTLQQAMALFDQVRAAGLSEVSFLRGSQR